MGRAPGAERFPKALRILKRREFLDVQHKGTKVSAGPLMGLALKNGRDVTRLGLTVSSKVGNAVVRGRIRRQLRELFRKRRDQLPRGLDVVLIARPSAKGVASEVLAEAYEGVAGGLRRSFP